MKFKQLEDFKHYQIYKDGTVIRKAHKSKNGSKLTRKKLIPTKGGNGYYHLKLTNNEGIREHFYVHRLVWTAFIGEIPNGMEIDHLDGNRSNNNLSNLQLKSHSDNCKNPSTLERYRISNARDKGKYDLQRLLLAKTKEYHLEVLKAYKNLKERDGKVKLMELMTVAHIGYPRAKRIIKEMEESKK